MGPSVGRGVFMAQRLLIGLSHAPESVVDTALAAGRGQLAGLVLRFP